MSRRCMGGLIRLSESVCVCVCMWTRGGTDKDRRNQDTHLDCFWAFIPFPDLTHPLCHSDVQREQTHKAHAHTYLSCRLVRF